MLMMMYCNLGKFQNVFIEQESNENETHENLSTIIKTTIIYSMRITHALCTVHEK